MKHITDLSLETLKRVAGEATRKAARDAVAAGRVVSGMKDGRLVDYGPGALPLSPSSADEVSVDAKVA